MSMQQFAGIQVTTTDRLEGWEVARYLGPVSVHLVAGVSILSDFFASFNDVFGGRSGAYGGELARLYGEAADALARKARLMGANGIVGLRIDFDEVGPGGGGGMFMLNAIGTAVSVRRPPAPGEEELAGPLRVPALEMDVLVRREMLLREVASGMVRLTPETWLFAMEHRVAEFGDAALGSMVGQYPDETARRTVEGAASRFFAALDPEDAIPWLYLGLVRDRGDGSDPQVRAFCVRAIHELNLLDFGRVAALLAGASPVERRMALQVATANTQAYGPGEIGQLAALHQQIRAAFPARWEPAQKRGFLGTGAREVWKCPCGEHPEAGAPHCPGCLTDTYGLRPSEANRDAVLAQIEARMAVLRQAFGVA